jgi:hypothetical protein
MLTSDLNAIEYAAYYQVQGEHAVFLSSGFPKAMVHFNEILFTAFRRETADSLTAFQN